MWVEKKTIKGSFWAGAYDTTFSKETIPVDEPTCLKMVDFKLCGPDSNEMKTLGNVSSFIKKPVAGEGAWLSTKEYSVINCVLTNIALTLEHREGPVISPFGIIAESPDDEKACIKDGTVLWVKDPKLVNFTTSCKLDKIMSRHGKVFSIDGINMSRLVDINQQLEYIILNKRENLCGNKTGNYVFGLPETFIIITYNLVSS